jgi:hypothetical protein
MLLNEALGIDKPSQRPPAQEMFPEGLYTPADKEDALRDYPREPLNDPRQPTQVEFADASGSVPMPARQPDPMMEPGASDQSDISADPAQPPMPERGERSPALVTGPLVQPNDSRYMEPRNIIVADGVLGGLLPWVQAATDVALGKVPADQFDQARMEHQERIQGLKEAEPDLAAKVEKAIPALAGLGIGLMRGGSGTVAGTAMRGAAAAGVHGAAVGYTSGDPSVPSLSGERVAGAAGQAVEEMAIGGIGAALPAGAMKGRQAYVDSKAAQAVADRKAAAAQKGKNTREAKKFRAQKDMRRDQMEEREKREDATLISRHQSFSQAPRDVSPKAKENRKVFLDDPIGTFKQQAAKDPSLENFSKMTGLSPTTLMHRLYGKNIKLETDQEKRLMGQLLDVEQAWMANRRQMGKPMAGGAANDNMTPGDQASSWATNALKPSNGKTVTVDQLYAAYKKSVPNPIPEAAFLRSLRGSGLTIRQMAGKARIEGELSGESLAGSAAKKHSGSSGGKPKSGERAILKRDPTAKRERPLPNQRNTKRVPSADRKPGDEPIRTPSKPNRFDRDY